VKYPKIILLRHGETKWNLEGRFQGRLDSPLTPKGRLQAEKNAIKLKNGIEDLDKIKIFSSPLERAKNTAFIICDRLNISKKRVIFDNRIIEFDYGVFEGKIRNDIINTEAFREREANKWNYKIENGESYSIVAMRVRSFLNSIRCEKKIIIIAHEMVNRTLRGVYLDLDRDKTLSLKQDNSTILILQDKKESILR
jgi:probable phosphoglycerate mutase